MDTLKEWLGNNNKLLINSLKSHLNKKELVLFQEKLDLSVTKFDNPNGHKFFESFQKGDLKGLSPWKKGPFKIKETLIDSEWDCTLKWERIKNHLPKITRKRVLDIGCGNGFYLNELNQYNPALSLGIDPSILSYFQFHTFKQYTDLKNTHIATIGIENLELPNYFFECILCLGVLYHRKDPLTLLKKCKSLLNPNGTLILETFTLEGENDISLFPKERYSGMRNVYFIPTISCFKNWALNSGFKSIEVASSIYTTAKEQRATNWAPFDSLKHGLNPENNKLTVEGYQAPLRTTFILKC